ncbi:MAG: TolC family protein [Gemmatimonadetes bacterium]|nr:TolC family protein [Gemmatimonadota bacterium]
MIGRFGRLSIGLALSTYAVFPPTLGAQRATADSTRLTLEDGIALALKNTLTVQLAAADVRQSAGALLEARGRFLPALGAGAGGFAEQGTTLLSSTATVPTDTRFVGAAWQLSSAVNLFNGFQDVATLRSAQLSRSAAQFALDRARQQAVFDVTQSFAQLTLDERLVEVAEANLALSRAREGQLEEQVRVGTRAPPDLFRQRAQTRADEGLVIESRNRARNDRVALLVRLRVDPARAVAIVPPAPDTLVLAESLLNATALAARALGDRADLGAARSRVEAADEAVRGARGGAMPRVVLGLDYVASARIFDWERVNGASTIVGGQRPIATQLGDQGVAVLSLGLAWPLFDRNRTRFDIERASVVADRERALAEDLRLRVIGEVERAVGDYRAAVQFRRTTVAGLAAAQEAFEAVQGRFDVGLASFIDLQSAQASLTQARAVAAQAEVNLSLQRDVLRLVTGSLATAR